jgi:hypothetical protein
MNGLVRNLVALGKDGLVVEPSIVTLNNLRVVAENFRTVAPIPSALLLNQICDSQLQPVHVKLLSCLIETVDSSASELPPALAIEVFNNLCIINHPGARRILSSVQSKWFENWRPSYVAQGSRRPKLKQDFIGMYDDRALGTVRITHSGVVRNLSDSVLQEAVSRLDWFFGTGSPTSDIDLIAKALRDELERRTGEKSSETTQKFIQKTGLE